eukprot:7645630-Pyramimonas_sp.AAC.1
MLWSDFGWSDGASAGVPEERVLQSVPRDVLFESDAGDFRRAHGHLPQAGLQAARAHPAAPLQPRGKCNTTL